MPAYVVLDVSVTDAEGYAEYRKMAAPVVERCGGRYLVRAGAMEVLEGDWRPERLVVLEFPDIDSARRWYDSPEYARLKAKRQSTTRSKLVLVAGV